MKPVQKNLFAAGLAFLLLSGCTLAPAYRQPDLPVAENLPAPQANRNSSPTTKDATTITAELGWREYFTDPRLQQCITLALANNRDLRVSALTVEAYQAQYRIQRSPYFQPSALRAPAANSGPSAAAIMSPVSSIRPQWESPRMNSICMDGCAISRIRLWSST